MYDHIVLFGEAFRMVLSPLPHGVTGSAVLSPAVIFTASTSSSPALGPAAAGAGAASSTLSLKCLLSGTLTLAAAPPGPRPAGLEVARDGRAAPGHERVAPAVEPDHELRLRRGRGRARPAVRRARGPAARRDEVVESALAVASSLRVGCPPFAAPFLGERGGEGDPGDVLVAMARSDVDPCGRGGWSSTHWRGTKYIRVGLTEASDGAEDADGDTNGSTRDRAGCPALLCSWAAAIDRDRQ
jgi:hypothetical protein